MKRIFYFLGIAALALAVSCNKDNKGGKDVDNIVEDGVYVVGEATGFTEVKSELLMASGRNEAKGNEVRAGMFEKYIVLQGGKEFTLTWINGGVSTKYGANLAAFTPDMDDDGNLLKPYEDNPKTGISKGKLEIGDTAPSMKVSETGLYHIVLDLNQANDLSFPQIVVAKADYGVRGGMNSWGFTAMDATAPSNDGITFTISDQKLATGGKFKFAYGAAWKITLDAEGEVRANTNLGVDCINGGDDIVVEDAGTYDITLTYKLAKGDISNSWKYEIKLKSKSELPTTMYMIGADFGGWNWGDAGVVEMIPVNGQGGHFWTIRYIEAFTEEVGDDGPYKTHGFKFCPVKDWNGDFAALNENVGEEALYNDGGNCFVKESGNYMIYVDYENSKLCIEKAKVYGIGECFGGWTEAVEGNLFVAEGNLLVGTVAASSNLRMYAASSIAVSDWWTREFNIFDGKIEYRGNGGDQAAVPASAGQKVSLDFNAGTGSIE